MSPSRSSLRHRTPLAAVMVAAATLAAVPAALAGGEAPPPGTKPEKCVPSYADKCDVDVAIAKTSDADTYAPGAVVTYTITVTNTGDVPVDRARIQVSDPLIADLAPIGPTTGTLDPGQSTQWVGTRTVSAAECGNLTNTATVGLTGGGYAGDDVNPGNDTATRTVVVAGAACTPPAPVVPVAQSPAVVTPPAKPAGKPVCPRPTLAAVLRGPGNPKAGQTTKYHITIRTTGVTARNVRVRLTLPNGFSLPGAGNVAKLRNGTLVIGVGTLRRGAPKTIPVTLQLDTSTRGARSLKASVTARCGGTAATTRTVQAVAAAPARVQPAVTG